MSLGTFKDSSSSLLIRGELASFIFGLVFVCVRRRKQEDLVQNVRRRLEEALMADSMAHVEDADAEVDKEEEKVEKVDKDEL